MSTLVRLASILLLAVACCGASPADDHSGTPTHAIESRASATVEDQTAERASEQTRRNRVLARLTRAQTGHDEQHTIRSSEPPGLQGAEASTTDIWAKWADLQSRIQSEEEALAACRAGSADCPAAARQFLQIVELGRQRQGRARLGEINRAVNFSIRPVDDWAQYGVADFWSTPLATLSAGAGDCEDYAIVKYVALRELGIAPDDLRILIVHNPRRRTNHAVLAVHLDEQWLILDNLTLIMVNSTDATHYRPLFVLDHRGVALDHRGVMDAAAAVVGK
jgi:predicted transglutaminase-like cysteine proteinase